MIEDAIAELVPVRLSMAVSEYLNLGMDEDCADSLVLEELIA